MKKGMKMNVLIIIAICIIFNIIGQLSLKKGMVTIGKTSVADFFTGKFFTIIFNYYVFFGLMLYGIGSFLWLVVLSKADLSFNESLRNKNLASNNFDMSLFKMLSKNREVIINLSIIVSIFIFLLRFFKPELLLEKTMISGGDTASQYYPAKYLADYLLPHGKIIGWSPGWYAGIPIFQFYFPLPFILIALIAYMIPLWFFYP